MTREHLIAMPFDPDRRDAFDLLPLLLREDAARGASALCALAASGHRGWVDLLLELEQEATRRGLHASWLASLLGCSERGRDLADASVVAGDGVRWRHGGWKLGRYVILDHYSRSPSMSARPHPRVGAT